MFVNSDLRFPELFPILSPSRIYETVLKNIRKLRNPGNLNLRVLQSVKYTARSQIFPCILHFSFYDIFIRFRSKNFRRRWGSQWHPHDGPPMNLRAAPTDEIGREKESVGGGRAFPRCRWQGLTPRNPTPTPHNSSSPPPPTTRNNSHPAGPVVCGFLGYQVVRKKYWD